MLVRLLSKTVLTLFVAGTVFTLIPNDAFARHHHHSSGGGSSCGGSYSSVPEIGTGAAAGALALLMGGAFMLKDRYFPARNSKSAE